MITKKTENGILVTDIDTFDVPSCLESGQCFRFERTSGGYSLVACGRRLVISERDGGWLFENVSEQDFESVWADYFDLKRDYNSIIESFAGDKVVYRAANACRGIRILRQDPWETTVSFIISQNNNIPRIKKIISALSEAYGRRIDTEGMVELDQLLRQEMAANACGLGVSVKLGAVGIGGGKPCQLVHVGISFGKYGFSEKRTVNSLGAATLRQPACPSFVRR